MNSIIFLLILMFLVAIVPLFIGSILLQILLSKKKNKFLGLIIPIFCCLLSLTIIIGSTMFTRSFFMLFLLNIPTLIYLGLYLGYSKPR